MLKRLRNAKWDMRKKLLLYMLFLTVLILFTLMAGIMMLGRFESVDKDLGKSLDFQLEVFEKDMAQYFESLAASSIDLARSVSDFIEADPDLAGDAFETLTDDAEKIEQIQRTLIAPLAQRLQKQNCSGVFVLLDATVNSSAEDADVSRTGLYLYSNRFQKDDSMKLLRGISAVGKEQDIMPHRKWRLEFRTDQFPDYNKLKANAALPLTEAYYLTNSVTLNGTSDRVVLMAIPVTGSDGRFYGICGYEVSEDYFMTYQAQPSKVSHLTSLLVPMTDEGLDIASGLHSGVYQGYHRPPSGKLLSVHNKRGNLSSLTNEEESYVGVTKLITLTPNNSPYTLVSMIPKSDYDHAVVKYVLQLSFLLVLLLFFAATCCVLFSRHYLRPILNGLEQIKSERGTERSSSIPEINDLFDYLAEQDRKHEQMLEELSREKRSIQSRYEQAEKTYAKAQTEYARAQEELTGAKRSLDRLAYARKNEIDPDDYQHFLNGMNELTKKEKEIFELYLDGKTAKEILVICGIKESTLKYHNHNILSKLGVSSRKQMLRYAELMSRDSESSDSEEPASSDQS